MQTKVHFFKSYYKMGWWAARLPETGGEWGDHSIDVLGFGVTTNQAERDLVRKEQELQFAETEELAA
jgi:hypothetical protein